VPTAKPSRLSLSSGAVKVSALAAVAAVAVGGAIVYAGADKNVTISVDGKARHVSDLAGTVGELLADEGIHTGARDLVAPAASAALADGQTVVVRYARQVTVTVDGAKRTYWTTQTSVTGALAALGLRADDARLSVSRYAPIGRTGLALVVTTPKVVTLHVDGVTNKVTTTSATVADLLAELGVTLAPRDKVNLVPGTAVTPGLAVAVTRITTKRQSVTQSVAFGTQRVSNSSMYTGQTKVTTAGHAGTRVAVYALTYVDGKLITKRLAGASLISAPVRRVVQVGTKAKAVSRPTSSGSHRSSGSRGGRVPVGRSGGLNWGALAECESGGNPHAVNPAGYYGLYQFSVSTWHSVGGSGNAASASPSEQTARAQILYGRTGASSWPVCGSRLFT